MSPALRKILSPSLPSADNIIMLTEALAASEHLIAKDYASAKCICDKLIDSPEWATASDSIKVYLLNLRGCLSINLGIDLGFSYFQRAKEIEPENFLATELIAPSFIKSEQFEEAKACYDQLIATEPEPSFLAHANRGMTLLKLQRSKEAIPDLEIALKLKPTDRNALENIAAAHHNLKNSVDAIKYANELLKLDPNFAKALFIRGKAKSTLGNTVESIDDLTRAIDLGYDLKNTVLLRALAFFRIQQFEKAVEDCETVLNLRVHQSAANITKGAALMSLNRFDEAEESLKTALESTTVSLERAEIHANLSSIYLRTGDVTAALEQCELSLLEKENQVAYNNRAFVLANIGRSDEALIDIEKAMSFETPSAITRSTRGLVYYQLGRMEEAHADFDKCLEEDPDLGEALFFRSRILKKLNLFADAEHDRRRANDLNYTLPPFSTISSHSE